MLATIRLGAATALVALVVPSAGCGGTQGPAPPGQVTLEGRLLDAETDEAVARDTVYMHFFCDDQGVQKSLEHDSATDYRVHMPGPTVRVRVYDASRTYHLFEETVTVAGDRRTFDVLLQPTGYVTLRGRVLLADTGRSLTRAEAEGSAAIGGHGPLFYFSSGGEGLHTGAVQVNSDGSYALKVPRAPIDIGAVDTALSVAQDRVDLTGVEGDAYEFDIVLE